MIYRFEKTLEQTWFVEVEADSFEEAKKNIKGVMWDADEPSLTTSRCLQFDDEDAAADYEPSKELEWEP